MPKTFRATVATLIAEEYDSEAYYIARKQQAPDSTPALDKFVGDAA
ncbi:hypothetical protein ABIA39_002284 [Nocardia sp. GAS34]